MGGKHEKYALAVGFIVYTSGEFCLKHFLKEVLHIELRVRELLQGTVQPVLRCRLLDCVRHLFVCLQHVCVQSGCPAGVRGYPAVKKYPAWQGISLIFLPCM